MIEIEQLRFQEAKVVDPMMTNYAKKIKRTPLLTCKLARVQILFYCVSGLGNTSHANLSLSVEFQALRTLCS